MVELLPAIFNVNNVSKEYPEVVKQDAEYGLVVVKPESLVEYMELYHNKPTYKSSTRRHDFGTDSIAYNSEY